MHTSGPEIECPAAQIPVLVKLLFVFYRHVHHDRARINTGLAFTVEGSSKRKPG